MLMTDQKKGMITEMISSKVIAQHCFATVLSIFEENPTIAIGMI